MVREFTVVIERDEEGYLVGSVPSLKGCYTQAKSMDELLERMREAIQLRLEVQDKERSPVLASSSFPPEGLPQNDILAQNLPS